MNHLPHWVLTDSHPAFYDSESATSIEMVAKIYGKMQELISDYNSYVDGLNKHIDEFEKELEAQEECFKECITNTVSDYIRTLDMRLDTAEIYMKDNLQGTAQILINKAIEFGSIKIAEEYDEVKESLNLIVTGEV